MKAALEILLTLVIGLSGSAAWAENFPEKETVATPPESPSVVSGQGEDVKPVTLGVLAQEMIEEDIAITEWFKGVADGLDLFLVPKRLTEKRNETHIKLLSSSFALEGAGAANTENVSVALRLPNVEEYWQLKFSSYDEEQDKRNIESGYLNQTPKVQNYGASVGFFRRLGDIRTAYQPRVTLENPLKVSQSLTFETIAELNKCQINPRWELFADPDKGTGTDISLNVNFNLTKRTSFTLLNTMEYDEVPHFFTTGNGFSFGRILNRDSSLSYSAIFNSTNVGNYHLDNYSLSVNFSHVIYRGILDFQLIPHWDFVLLQHFRGQPGLVFNLFVTF